MLPKEEKLCLVCLGKFEFPLFSCLQVQFTRQANHPTPLTIRKKPHTVWFCTSLLVPNLLHVHNITCTFTPPLPPSCHCLLTISKIPAQVGHSHLYRPSRGASAQHWDHAASPLSFAVPKKQGEESCPTLVTKS